MNVGSVGYLDLLPSNEEHPLQGVANLAQWHKNLWPHQMWVTKWLWFFVTIKTILEVFYWFSLSTFTCCYCWSIFKWKRSAELCKIAAHLVKWDITFQSYLFLVLCCDELCSQCKEIWRAVFMVMLEGWYLLSYARKSLSAVVGFSMCASNRQCLTRAGKGWQKRKKWWWYNGNMLHKASIRAAQRLSSVMESLHMHMQ